MKTVVAIYTAMAIGLMNDIKQMIAEEIPGCRLINIADDSLIQDVIKAGGPTPSVTRRLLDYYRAAEEAGADIILNTCSSIGEVAEMGRKSAKVPLVKIDDAMTLKAVNMGNRVGVIATLPTTLGPTVRLVKSQAKKIDKSITVVEGLAVGAFEALMSGKADEHDALILETAKNLAGQVDVIVLAQGSMAKMQDKLAKETGKPVLSSPLLGVQEVRDLLKGAAQ
ncbi:MAG TPA: aspartate/glutamate racemase family protein [Negativicutes bacterium]|nr:aspartate/glutamate racemase family protein [Negativicutes bacterium]